MTMKIERQFVFHVRHKTALELHGLGVCGYRYVYYQLGRRWAFYRDHPFSNRNKMLKKRFLNILEHIKCEPPLGSKGRSLKFNSLINCRLKRST